MASGVECSLNHAIASSALGKHAHARIFWIAEDLIRALPSQTQLGWEQLSPRGWRAIFAVLPRDSITLEDINTAVNVQPSQRIGYPLPSVDADRHMIQQLHQTFTHTSPLITSKERSQLKALLASPCWPNRRC